MSKYNIQNIFTSYGPDYIKNNKLTEVQWKVYNSIINCKTNFLGTHSIICKDCCESITSLNSCRNRHCPMCQSYAREKWIQKESSYSLDCQYFHIVTTIPSELNKIVLYNPTLCYNILFKATSDSILDLANDKKWLGAKVGLTSILHTWGQSLEFHPHIHSIVTGGGVVNNKWVNSKENYLFEVQVLSALFRGKFLALLKSADLIFPPDMQYLNDDENFNKFLQPLYQKTWITYIEPPKGNPQNVIEYIGRYSFRVAISNERIKDISEGMVTFEFKDYKDNSKIKTMTISASEFIRRFLLHVLPKRFNKIRHYGLLTNRNKKSLIALCRILIGTVISSNFTCKNTRVLKQFVCKSCGCNSFIYSFSYAHLARSTLHKGTI